MHQYGIIHGLAKVIREYQEKDEKIVICALRIIARYLSTDFAPSTFFEVHGIELLQNTIHTHMNSNTTIINLAFAAIENLCRLNENASKAVSGGIMNDILMPFDFYFGKDEDLIRRMLIALAALATSDEGKDAASQLGCVSVAFNVLRLYLKTNTRLCCAACRLLHEMAENQFVLESIAQPDLISTLIDSLSHAMNSPIDERLANGILSVLILLAAGKPSALCEDDSITQLIEGLCVFQHNLTIIHSLFIVFTQIVSQETTSVVADLINIGIIPHIIPAFQEHYANNPSIARVGTGLLAYLVQNTSGSLECLTKGGMELLLKVIAVHSNQPEVLTNASCALLLLSQQSDQDQQEEFLEHAASSGLVSTLINFCYRFSQGEIEKYHAFIHHALSTIGRLLTKATVELVEECIYVQPLPISQPRTEMTTTPLANPSPEVQPPDNVTEITDEKEEGEEEEEWEEFEEEVTESEEEEQPTSVDVPKPNGQPLSMISQLHSRIISFGDPSLVAGCLTMLGHLYTQILKMVSSDDTELGQSPSDRSEVRKHILTSVQDTLEWMVKAKASTPTDENDEENEAPSPQVSPRSSPTFSLSLISSFASFFGNAATCADTTVSTSLSETDAVDDLRVFSDSLPFLFDCLQTILEYLESDEEDDRTVVFVLMKMWLCVVNVLSLSCHAGTAIVADVTQQLSPALLESLRDSMKIGMRQNSQSDGVSTPDEIPFATQSNQSQRGKLSRVLLRTIEMILVVLDTNTPTEEADEGDDQIRMNDLCQLAVDVSLTMQTLWEGIDLQARSEWQLLSESVKVLHRLVENASETGNVIIVQIDPEPTTDQKEEKMVREEKEERDEEGSEDEESHSEEDESANDQNDDNQEISTKQEPQDQRRLPSINQAGLTLIQIMHEAVRLKDWAVSNNICSILLVLFTKSVFTNTADMIEVIQNEEDVVGLLSQTLRLTEMQCKSIRCDEVEAEEEHDSKQELADVLQLELALHSLFTEFTTQKLSVVLTKTQVLNSLLSAIAHSPPLSLLSSALSLLYHAASLLDGASKIRQMNGVVILASLLHTLLSQSPYSPSVHSVPDSDQASLSSEEESVSVEKEIELCCGVLALLSVNEGTRRAFSVESVIDVALHLLQRETSKLRKTKPTQTGKEQLTVDDSNTLFFVISFLSNAATVPETISFLLKDCDDTLITFIDALQQIRTPVLLQKLASLIDSCITTRTEDANTTSNSLLSQPVLIVLIPSLLDAISSIIKKGSESDLEQLACCTEALLKLLTMSLLHSPLTETTTRKKKDNDEEHPKQQRLALTLINSHHGWSLMSNTIFFGIHSAHPNIITSSLVVTTALAADRSFEKHLSTSDLEALLSSFHTATNTQSLSEHPSLLLGFMDTFILLCISPETLSQFVRKDGVESVIGALRVSLGTANRIIRSHQESVIATSSISPTKSTEIRSVDIESLNNVLCTLLRGSLLLVSSSFVNPRIKKRMVQGGTELLLRDVDKVLGRIEKYHPNEELLTKTRAMTKRLKSLLEV
ncbi:hypothetical protein BLNAU_3721 [Blattamonas nauphoetae]|uniref:Uncharacterized protein n=1 Tax=Blattamonas nauphoetae TaxID=2049346 RepID=A0ABQ9YC29_9EUKA|nr:hypothetical protein BLNAU_3721 [Blattamonas nauphoetae]